MSRTTSSVAVIGVGAVGGVAASSLMEHGVRPLLGVRHPFDSLMVHGPRSTATHQTFELAFAASGLKPHDVVILATKAHQTSDAAGWIRALVGHDSIVLVLQNGVEHEARVRPFIEHGAPVVPGVVDIPAERTAPGSILVRRGGKIRLPNTEPARRVAWLFAPTPAVLGVETVDDFDTVLWRKLAVNVVSGAIPTLTNRPAGVFREAAVQRIARELVRECVQVAQARGVPLPDELVDEVVSGFANATPSAVNSMLRDRREGRTLEAESRNGAVARLGAEAGVATPHNAMAAAILGAMNRGPPDETA